MAYRGEYSIERYGARAAEQTPPIAKMIEAGLPVSAGTDATRVASYNPWICLSWFVTGKTVGGARLYPMSNCLDRTMAPRLWTDKSTWFSNEVGKKGRIGVGQLADVAVLDQDYCGCSEDQIRDTTSVLTIAGGKPIYGAEEFVGVAPALPPPMPDWRRRTASAAIARGVARIKSMLPCLPATAIATCTAMLILNLGARQSRLRTRRDFGAH